MPDREKRMLNELTIVGILESISEIVTRGKSEIIYGVKHGVSK